MNYNRGIKDEKLVQHEGVFRRQISLWEAAALILSGTVGAGILGIPYAIAKVGMGLGILYIVVIGLLMMSMNLLVGRVAVSSNEPLQLAGLAYKYLGKTGGRIMTGLSYTLVLSILAVYIIGAGQTLQVLFGGQAFFWSLAFFVIESTLVAYGLRTVKSAEGFLVVMLFLLIFFLTAYSLPHVQIINWTHIGLKELLFPYGVLIFAFHSTRTVPEAYSLLQKKEATFKRAIILSSLSVIAIYILFSLLVVGATGLATTEIATIGLGAVAGKSILILGNLFAVLAMGTGFLMAGVSLRDSLRWDFHVSDRISTLFVCGVPLVIFLLGLRQFITAISLIGGVLMSLELLLTLAIYWLSKRKENAATKRYGWQHVAPIFFVLLLALAVGTVYSVGKLF